MIMAHFTKINGSSQSFNRIFISWEYIDHQGKVIKINPFAIGEQIFKHQILKLIIFSYYFV